MRKEEALLPEKDGIILSVSKPTRTAADENKSNFSFSDEGFLRSKDHPRKLEIGSEDEGCGEENDSDFPDTGPVFKATPTKTLADENKSNFTLG